MSWLSNFRFPNSRLWQTKHLWQWDLRSGEMKGAAERPVALYEATLKGDDVMVKVEQEIIYDYDEEDDFDEDDFFGAD